MTTPPPTGRDDQDAEWRDPANWHAGVLGIYYSARDPRALVPKRPPGIGFTVNFARPLGAAVFVGLLALSTLGVVVSCYRRR